MRTLNEQGIVFGLLPEEVQKEMKEAEGEAYMFFSYGWEKVSNPSWCSVTVYKVEIQDEPEVPENLGDAERFLWDKVTSRIDWLLDQHRNNFETLTNKETK